MKKRVIHIHHFHHGFTTEVIPAPMSDAAIARMRDQASFIFAHKKFDDMWDESKVKVPAEPEAPANPSPPASPVPSPLPHVPSRDDALSETLKLLQARCHAPQDGDYMLLYMILAENPWVIRRFWDQCRKGLKPADPAATQGERVWTCPICGLHHPRSKEKSSPATGFDPNEIL